MKENKAQSAELENSASSKPVAVATNSFFHSDYQRMLELEDGLEATYCRLTDGTLHLYTECCVLGTTPCAELDDAEYIGDGVIVENKNS